MNATSDRALRRSRKEAFLCRAYDGWSPEDRIGTTSPFRAGGQSFKLDSSILTRTMCLFGGARAAKKLCHCQQASACEEPKSRPSFRKRVNFGLKKQDRIVVAKTGLLHYLTHKTCPCSGLRFCARNENTRRLFVTPTFARNSVKGNRSPSGKIPTRICHRLLQRANH